MNMTRNDNIRERGRIRVAHLLKKRWWRLDYGGLICGENQDRVYGLGYYDNNMILVSA